MNPVETVWTSTWPWPAWIAILALVVVVVAVWLLYRRETTNLNRWQRWTLFALRGALVLLLMWMLGGWQRQLHRTEPAQLVIALDQSLSMSFADDYRDSSLKTRASRWIAPWRPSKNPAAPTRLELAQAILEHPQNGWSRWLSDQYRVRWKLLGDEARDLPANDAIMSVRPTRPASKLGQNVRDLLREQQGNPTAAVVLFTDGATTSGPRLAEAAEVARRQGVPLFIVGMGGEDPPRDLRLADLLADDVAFSGDLVQLQVQLHTQGLAGQKTTVRVRRADTGESLAETPVTIDANSGSQTIRIGFRPQATGELPLAVEAIAVPGESDLGNNRLTHTLHVNDVAIKVLYVQAYPSYEFRNLANLLARTKLASDPSRAAFDLRTVLQEADRGHVDQDPTAMALFPVSRDELFTYDVVLFGDVDPTLLGRAALENLAAYVREHGGSVVFLAGPRFTPRAYRDTRLAELFPFEWRDADQPPPVPALEPFRAKLTPIGAGQPACQLGGTPAENQALWNSLPELYWYWPITALRPAARVLVEHPGRLTPDRRPLPLVSLQYLNSGRVLFQAIDETYRWARHPDGELLYARYWLQTLRTLSRPKLLAGQSLAELATDRQQYLPGDVVQVRVRFREVGERSQGASVAVEHASGVRQVVPLQPSSEEGIVTAELPQLPAGSYRVTLAQPLLDPPPAPRTFIMVDDEQEQVGVPMRSAELAEAASKSGGQYAPWSDVSRLLRKLPRGQRVRIESLPPEPVWNTPWVAAGCLILLTSEWLLRKRWGLL